MSDSPDLDRLSSDLVVSSARLVRAVRRTVKQPTGVRVLSLLDEHESLSVTELAEADRCSQPTMSGTVNALLAREWVTKSSDPEDARRCVVRLTESGLGELQRFRAEAGRSVADRIRRHGDHRPEDVQSALALLRAILGTTPAQEGNK